MMNALDVSSTEIADPSGMPSQPQYNMNYLANEGVNDDLINDIQKRLELLDEFK
jgi:hypothetical protein